MLTDVFCQGPPSLQKPFVFHYFLHQANPKPSKTTCFTILFVSLYDQNHKIHTNTNTNSTNLALPRGSREARVLVCLACGVSPPASAANLGAPRSTQKLAGSSRTPPGSPRSAQEAPGRTRSTQESKTGTAKILLRFYTKRLLKNAIFQPRQGGDTLPGRPQELPGAPGTPQEPPGGPREAQEAPGSTRKHQEPPGSARAPQETPRDTQEAPRAPEMVLKPNFENPLCFTI